MPTLDPASLLFTNGLLSLVLTAVMLVSRIGLGDLAKGVRTWIVGDLLVTCGRVAVLYELMQPDFGRFTRLAFPTLAGTLAVLGITCHLQALRRIAGLERRHGVALGQCAALGALFTLPALQLPTVWARLLWMNVLIGGLSILSLNACWPMRRLWGARLIGAAMLVASIVQSLRVVGVLLGLLVGHAPDDSPLANDDLRPMLFELIVALFITSSFALLLQEHLRERLERLGVTDALTSVLNRRGLMPPLQRELAQSSRSGRPMSVVLLDLDQFKRINDNHGHAVGDDVLAGFAARVGTLMRGGDVFGRWGGEEFLLLLPGTAAREALGVAERIRAVVGATPLADGAPQVTVSGGVASAAEVQGVGDALLRMLALADERLYLAKQTRNRIVAPSE